MTTHIDVWNDRDTDVCVARLSGEGIPVVRIMGRVMNHELGRAIEDLLAAIGRDTEEIAWCYAGCRASISVDDADIVAGLRQRDCTF